MRQDITMHSDDELSLLVFNDEGLYLIRRSLRLNPRLLDEMFLYTDKQLEVLQQDLEDDYNEDLA